MSIANSERSESVVDLATWRQAHEIHSLRDMLAIYRQWATAIAAENARLHEENAMLRATASSAQRETLLRSRGDCQA